MNIDARHRKEVKMNTIAHIYFLGLFGWALLAYGLAYAFSWYGYSALLGVAIWSLITARLDKKAQKEGM